MNKDEVVRKIVLAIDSANWICDEIEKKVDEIIECQKSFNLERESILDKQLEALLGKKNSYSRILEQLKTESDILINEIFLKSNEKKELLHDSAKEKQIFVRGVSERQKRQGRCGKVQEKAD